MSIMEKNPNQNRMATCFFRESKLALEIISKIFFMIDDF